MPGSINIPFLDVIDPKTKTMRSDQELLEIFSSKNLNLDSPIILTCGSGVTACILYTALEKVGAKSISIVRKISMRK